MPCSDNELLARVRRGDSGAFETLAGRYREQIETRVFRMLRDRDAASDIAQDVLLRVWTHAEQWRGAGSCQAWLFRIATNLALNYLRSPSHSKETPSDEAEERTARTALHSPDDPDAVIERAEEREILARLIERLPDDKRQVLRLALATENDLQSVAASLSIPRGTVKSRLHYARKLLVREWKEIASEWED